MTNEKEKIGAKRKIAVLTGGGDAQGMNAALRAVSRMALRQGWKVYGIRDGFYGLYEVSKAEDPRNSPHLIEMDWETMSWAIREGGLLAGNYSL